MTPSILTHALAFLTGGIAGILALCVWCVITAKWGSTVTVIHTASAPPPAPKRQGGAPPNSRPPSGPQDAKE